MTKVQKAVADLAAAHRTYQQALAGAYDCPAAWPPDPPHPGYPGTRCQLLAGHDGAHRHRVRGSSVTVDWGAC